MPRQRNSNLRIVHHIQIRMPLGSMYGIFSNINHKHQLNVGKYIIHGWYGMNFQNSTTKVLRIDNVKYHMTKGEPINRAIGKVIFSLNLGIVKSQGSL